MLLVQVLLQQCRGGFEGDRTLHEVLRRADSQEANGQAAHMCVTMLMEDAGAVLQGQAAIRQVAFCIKGSQVAFCIKGSH